jgi:hypothetical protein
MQAIRNLLPAGVSGQPQQQQQQQSGLLADWQTCERPYPRTAPPSARPAVVAAAAAAAALATPRDGQTAMHAPCMRRSAQAPCRRCGRAGHPSPARQRRMRPRERVVAPLPTCIAHATRHACAPTSRRNPTPGTRTSQTSTRRTSSLAASRACRAARRSWAAASSPFSGLDTAQSRMASATRRCRRWKAREWPAARAEGRSLFVGGAWVGNARSKVPSSTVQVPTLEGVCRHQAAAVQSAAAGPEQPTCTARAAAPKQLWGLSQRPLHRGLPPRCRRPAPCPDPCTGPSAPPAPPPPAPQPAPTPAASPAASS